MMLINLLRAHARVDLRGVILLSAMSAISATLVLFVVNVAAGLASKGEISLRLLLLMAIAVLGFAWAQHKSNLIAAREAEHILHGMRERLFNSVRKSSPDTLADIGQGPLQAALTQEMQTVSMMLPMILIGVQQLVMLIFVGLYMLFLSPVAFAMIVGFSGIAGFVHLNRMRAIQLAGRQAIAEEGRLFAGLTDLLHGFKEVRMNRTRREDLVHDLHDISGAARDAKSAIKKQWGREFALIQLAFYVMMGLMVFVVPMFTDGYHQAAMQTTTVALFMIGPISAFLQSVPAFGEAENALAQISMLDYRMQTESMAEIDATHGATDTNTGEENLAPLPGTFDQITLADVNFAYREPDDGKGFAIGPIDLSFRPGEITFITGGNGSGKSTLIALLTGLRHPTSGHITVDGIRITDRNIQAYRNHFATVFGDYHLFDTLYGIDQVDPDRVASLLAEMEIDEKVHLVGEKQFSTTKLSQGQRKRLALVAARLEDKPVLVLDEWAADQDPYFRKQFYEVLLPALRAEGKIIICVTHDDRWFGIADHLYHMHDGKIQSVTPA
jgi:putative ATP-binding cassette transporter